MGCQVCSNKFDIKLENTFNDNKLLSKRNLNYLIYNINKNDIKLNPFDSKGSSNQTNTNNIQNNSTEASTYLETMRESMIMEINSIRKNPSIIIEKINKYSPFIKSLSKDSFIQVDKNNKIKLNQGKDLFESFKNIIIKKKPMSELILKNELTFPFPTNSEYEYIDNSNLEFIQENYLTITLKKIKNILYEKNIELVNFHYDIMNSNIELSVLLQIVDDTNSMFQRRNNLLNRLTKYIGINIGKMSNGLYCYYLLFGKDKTILK